MLQRRETERGMVMIWHEQKNCSNRSNSARVKLYGDCGSRPRSKFGRVMLPVNIQQCTAYPKLKTLAIFLKNYILSVMGSELFSLKIA